MSTENSSAAGRLALWLRNQVASPNLTPRQFAGAVWTDDAKEAAASAMLVALMKITQRLDDQKVHGIDPSQDIEDFANAAIAAAKAAGIKTEG